jgi:Phosphoenolpyruvate phosphomutase
VGDTREQPARKLPDLDRIGFKRGRTANSPTKTLALGTEASNAVVSTLSYVSGTCINSGFELAASYAVPDANILAWGTHLEMMRAIASVVSIPLIADID